MVARFIFILFCFGLLQGPQQLKFEKGEIMPQARSTFGQASGGSCIYISGGFTKKKGYTKDLLQYDVNTQTWSKLPNSNIATSWGNIEFVNSKLFLFNGLLKNGYYNSQLQIYDVEAKKYQLGASVPVATKSAGSAVYQGEIYVFGGKRGHENGKMYSKSMYKYNPQADEWLQLAEMPQAKETEGVFVNGMLYVIGGYYGYSATSKAVDRYDPETNMWERVGELQYGVSAHALAVKGDRIFIVGDYQNLIQLSYYDVVSNTHVVLEPKSLTGRRHCGAEVIGNKLYVFGGNQAADYSTALANMQFTAITELESE